MDWVPLQNTAKGKGQLVFAMRQDQTPAMTQPGPWGTSTSGYCLCLVAAWISHAYAGKNFPMDASKVCDNQPWQATWGQTLSETTNAKNWVDQWVSGISPFQMSVSDGLRERRNTNPTASLLHSMAITAYGCYAVTLVRTGGAHALGLRHGRDNRMHLFDPNYGHFAVHDHTLLKAFITWYLGVTGYGARYDAATCVIGIRPPIE